MNPNFKIITGGVSTATIARKLYFNGNYEQAKFQLIKILDIEPENWASRLMLAVCYFNTAELAAAMRSFKFICEKCPISELKLKAAEGLEACNAKMVKAPEHFIATLLSSPPHRSAG